MDQIYKTTFCTVILKYLGTFILIVMMTRSSLDNGVASDQDMDEGAG